MTELKLTAIFVLVIVFIMEIIIYASIKYSVIVSLWGFGLYFLWLYIYPIFAKD